jgi:hypothetical protein
MRIRVADLDPLHSPAVAGDRPSLRRLRDEQLIEACEQPANDDPVRVNTTTGRLIDGNGRAHELKRRASDPRSIITDDTTVACEPYSPDHSMFEDINR